MTTDTITPEIEEFVSVTLREAVAEGILTPGTMEAVNDAMRARRASVRYDEDGTFTVMVGTVPSVQGHITQLPSVAAEWEAKLT